MCPHIFQLSFTCKLTELFLCFFARPSGLCGLLANPSPTTVHQDGNAVQIFRLITIRSPVQARMGPLPFRFLTSILLFQPAARLAASLMGSFLNMVTQDALAQLGERETEDLKVPGSIPGLGTCSSLWLSLQNLYLQSLPIASLRNGQ